MVVYWKVYVKMSRWRERILVNQRNLLVGKMKGIFWVSSVWNGLHGFPVTPIAARYISKPPVFANAHAAFHKCFSNACERCAD